MTTDELRALFRARFNAQPEIIASAPGRVNIIGEHTDYNGGQVLPIAIDRRTYVALRVAQGNRSRVFSQAEARAGEFDAQAPDRAGAWWDYMAGVCAEITSDGIVPPQFDAVVASDVPIGAGLSSSAAREVATGLGLSALAKQSLAKKGSGAGRLASRKPVRRRELRCHGSICISTVRAPPRTPRLV